MYFFAQVCHWKCRSRLIYYLNQAIPFLPSFVVQNWSGDVSPHFTGSLLARTLMTERAIARWHNFYKNRLLFSYELWLTHSWHAAPKAHLGYVTQAHMSGKLKQKGTVRVFPSLETVGIPGTFQLVSFRVYSAGWPVKVIVSLGGGR